MGEKYLILKNGDFSDFEGQSYKYGVETLNLSSLEEFHKVVKKFNRYTDYIWRGQRKDWKLSSTFDRIYKFSKEKDRKKELDKILDSFKKRLEDLPNTHNIDFSKEYEIWAIGQHHGLPTPLLDWTKNPYMAAYFAFYKKGTNEQCNRIVYALNRVVKRLIIKEKDAKTKVELSKQRKIEFDFDINHFVQEHHQRLINQEGAFTKAFKGDDIKSIVQKFWDKDSKGEKNYISDVILAEILIPDKSRNECLSFLKSKDITHGVLFPDYAGAVEICKINLGLDKFKLNSDLI